MSFAVSPRPCRGGDRGGVSDIKEGDGRCRVWTKKLTPPPAPKPHPYPLSKGRGDFKCGVESKWTNSIYIFFICFLIHCFQVDSGFMPDKKAISVKLKSKIAYIGE